MSSVWARDIRLNAQSKNICITKTAKLFQARNQLDVLAVNGVSSRRATFWYSGHHSRLELDFHTANVHATCNSRGRDVYSFVFSPAYNDPNNYLLTYTVNCVPCVSSRLSTKKAMLHKQIKILQKYQERPQYQKLKVKTIKELKQLMSEVEKQLRSEETSPDVIEQLHQLRDTLERLYSLIMEDQLNGELMEYMLKRLLA